MRRTVFRPINKRNSLWHSLEEDERKMEAARREGRQQVFNRTDTTMPFHVKQRSVYKRDK